jgi:D-3-phosphoglycerate dehydrogenase
MKIAVMDDYQDAVRKLSCYSLLADHDVKVFNNTVKGVGQLSVRLADTEALVLIRERSRIGKELLLKLPKLRLISQTGGVGRSSVSHVDLAACTARGVAVAEGGGSPVAAAELTWALIMAASRRLPQYISNLKHGVWQQSGLKAATAPPNHGLGEVLRGKTLGIWGYGRIGRLVAGYGAAFGMKVIVWGGEKSQVAAREQGLDIAASKAELFERADVLSLHLRLADTTRGAVELADLRSMKPTALFVNTSRAELIAPDALVAALNSGAPGLAAIDVFESEPLLAGQPLLRMENVICTPHIGYVEKESYERYFSAAFRNILAFAAGRPENIVNPEVLGNRPQAA